MRVLHIALLFIVIGGSVAIAALRFPELSGRVVDEADVLAEPATQKLEQMLADYERGTSNQVVVVTLSSLQGTTIEDYGYQLGRHWQIGQKEKDNGALLIVAPGERAVRIEVGYGLEPLLTDAASSTIIQSIILPHFRAGNMEQGIVEGTEAMLSVLGGKGIPQTAEQPMSGWQMLLLLLVMYAFFRFAIRYPLLTALALSSGASRFGSSRIGGSGWGGGFRGGGGSFGGGGASGRW